MRRRSGLSGWAGPQFSCHAVRVRLDRDTGVVRVLEVSAAHDSGTIINPVGAHGQVEGGVLMGIGQALTERTVYGDDGNQRNPALLDYKLQTIADAPTDHDPLRRGVTPNMGPTGPSRSPRRRTCRPRPRSRTRSPSSSAPGPAAADDRRTGLADASKGERHELSSSPSRSTRRSPRWPPAPARSPAAPTSSSAPARARRRCRDRWSPSTASPSCAASRPTTAGSGSAPASPTPS